MNRQVATIALAGALAGLAHGDAAVAQRMCSALESQMFQLQAGGVDRREAARMRMLRQRLARAGCGSGGQSARSTRARSEPRRQRGVSRRTEPRSHALRRPVEEAPQSTPSPPSGGTYRTMCVRTCDGYYFPVSFSTTREHFSEDAETCTRMCPGSDAALYLHSVPDELPSDMVSVEGEAYSELPNAFRYRRSLDPSCSCGEPLAGDGAANGTRQEEADERSRPALLPQPRPAPATDPVTIANRLGGFSPTRVEPGAFASAQGRFGKPVRVVGPEMLGSQMSDLLLRPVAD